MKKFFEKVKSVLWVSPSLVKQLTKDISTLSPKKKEELISIIRNIYRDKKTYIIVKWEFEAMQEKILQIISSNVRESAKLADRLFLLMFEALPMGTQEKVDKMINNYVDSDSDDYPDNKFKEDFLWVVNEPVMLELFHQTTFLPDTRNAVHMSIVNSKNTAKEHKTETYVFAAQQKDIKGKLATNLIQQPQK